ncbi:hypothetical protein [Methylosinus sp. Sm6]|uniref:hypothetical protein n=1 Tax=Methylosinus sp. Sm6 TaxID=2866948 RepID=UPI001C9963EB|nr:hypothetical protein [Methylosinus sp. Sm6]MBY6243889.1 hypothetical protein [Methylosinus sp. Sm6]
MEELTPILIPAAVGFALGGGVLVLARLSARWPQLGSRRALGYALVATAALYVGLAFASDNVKAWFGIEMTGFAIFGSFGLLGIVGSPWWLVAGFALHPLWHVQFHYLGTGAVFTPAWFALGLSGFDAAIALYVIVALLAGLDASLQRKAPAAKAEAALTRNERRLAKKSR